MLASLLVVSGAIWIYLHAGMPWQFLIGQDELEYADLARRIARGDGFTSGLTYPVELGLEVTGDRPNLIRAPVWPYTLAAVFAAFAPTAAVAHGLLLVIFCLTVVTCGAIGARLAGPLVGLAAGLAVATTSVTQTLAFLSLTEPLFGLLIAIVFLLMARNASPLAIGAACGLVYLTRYNGIVILPAVALWCLFHEKRWATLGWFLTGFTLVGLPWWIRNTVLTGDPFYTYYSQLTHLRVEDRGAYSQSLMHYLDPTTAQGSLVSPLQKLRQLFPLLIARQSAFANVNLAACVGVAIGCARRDRLAIVFALFAVAFTVIIALVLPRGRYFAPLFPVFIVIGCVGWRLAGCWAGAFGIALIVLAPLYPAPTPLANDLEFIRAVVNGNVERARDYPWSTRCIQPDDLVVGERASEIAWTTDATTIWLTATPDDFWEVINRFPVEFVYIARRREFITPRFLEHFEPRDDCAKHLYQRRRPR